MQKYIGLEVKNHLKRVWCCHLDNPLILVNSHKITYFLYLYLLDFHMEESGCWNVQCQYTETRKDINQILKEPTVSSNTINLNVLPGN